MWSATIWQLLTPHRRLYQSYMEWELVFRVRRGNENSTILPIPSQWTIYSLIPVCMWLANHLIGSMVGMCIVRGPRKCNVKFFAIWHCNPNPNPNPLTLTLTLNKQVNTSLCSSDGAASASELLMQSPLYLPQLSCCRSLLQFQNKSCNQHHYRPCKQPIPDKHV